MPSSHIFCHVVILHCATFSHVVPYPPSAISSHVELLARCLGTRLDPCHLCPLLGDTILTYRRQHVCWGLLRAAPDLAPAQQMDTHKLVSTTPAPLVRCSKTWYTVSSPAPICRSPLPFGCLDPLPALRLCMIGGCPALRLCIPKHPCTLHIPEHPTIPHISAQSIKVLPCCLPPGCVPCRPATRHCRRRCA